MKKLIHSQRFGMISEICDRIATDSATQAMASGLKFDEALTVALTIRLDTEIELNGASDDSIIRAYERIVLNDK